MPTTTTIHVPAGTGTRCAMPDGDHILKASVHDSQGELEVFEVHAQAAPAAPLHTSPWTGVLYLLRGRVTVWVGEEEFTVEPGDLVIMPAGTPCTFEVVGEEALILGVTSGNGAGRFFTDFAATVPTDPASDGFGAAVASVTQRHGVALGNGARP